MSEKKIKVAEAKGRPMLHWVGKKPLNLIKSFPAQLVEVYEPASKGTSIENPTYDVLKDNWQNLLFHGDNKEVIGFLLANGFRGKIDVIYIDPPFDSGANYIRKVELRGTPERIQLDGEEYVIGEQIQYHDIWANDNYLQFMYERLLLLKELLSEDGSIFLNVDEHKGHFLRILMDEVFGSDNFINEIVWHYPDKFQGNVKGLANNHQTIFWYAKSSSFTSKKVYVELEKPTKRDKRIWSKEKQRLVAAKDEKGNTIYELYTKRKIDDVWRIGQTSVSKSYSSEYYGYPTQKPEELLRRIIELSSNKNDLVFDSFIGSGTTAAVAQKMERRWIGVDINKGAIQTTSKRLQTIISNQYEENKGQIKLDDDEVIINNHYSFSHYKVNDYDLQLLKSEATELAMRHIGIQRIKTDHFFEGVLGKNLVKIIDFNHPLTLLDLQLIQDELKKRPDENRNITVVCLGKELTVDPWIEDYNKKHSVNKLESIELRTDQKYGKFLIHKPASAQVDFNRKDNKAVIKLNNFISPTIIERLNDPESLVKVKIPDFRSMIDVILIDTDYDGKVFNIRLSDVPEKKSDLVKGNYEIDIPEKKTTVAIKIIDMLGEEVIVTEEI